MEAQRMRLCMVLLSSSAIHIKQFTLVLQLILLVIHQSVTLRAPAFQRLKASSNRMSYREALVN